MTPGCDKTSKCRGLCSTCYSSAIYHIKQGHITWEKLEASGLAQPATVRLGGNLFTAAMDAKLQPVDQVELAMERAAVKMAKVCERMDQDNWGTPDAQPRREPEPAAPPCDPDLDGDESFVDPLRPVDEAFDPPTGVSQAEVQSAEKVWPVDKVATEPATALMEDWQYDGSTGSDVEKKHDAQDTPVKPTGINGFNSPGTCPPVEPAKARRGRRKTAEEFAEAPAEPETKKPWEVV
jgi:hypothetical protein